MRIPVFVSAPSDLNRAQENKRKKLLSFLEELNMEPRALGRSDYPTDLPLREVQVIAKHCAGGLILGFSQFNAPSGTWKKGTKKETVSTKTVAFPTPWNHLEAGILFSLGKPLLVFREDGVSGGVFDHGVTDVFVHSMPSGKSKDRNYGKSS